MRKVVISGFAFVAIVAVLLGGAFLFREELAAFAAARLLPGEQVTLTRLEGLEVSASRLSVAQLEFQLHESGQRLVLANFELGFVAGSFTRAPVVDTVTVGSAQLLADAGAARRDAGEGAASAATNTRISEVLALLRSFPLARVAVDDLRVPWRSIPLAIALERGEGMLAARVASGALNLRAQFSQADAASAANLRLALTRGEAGVGDFSVTLEPMGAAYALSGNGTLNVSDLEALLGELEQAPLPLRAVQLDWELAGALADDLGGAGAGAPQTFTLGLQAGSRLVLPAGLAEGLGELAFEASDRLELTVTSGAGLVLGSERLPLRVTGSWRDAPASVDAVLRITSCALAANPACALEFDGSASLGTYTMNGRVSAAALGEGTFELASAGLTLGGLPDWLPRFDVQGRMQVRDDATIGIAAKLLARDGPSPVELTLDGAYDPARGSADLHAVLPELAFMEEGRALSTWFNAWPFTFDVLAGSIAADANLAWNAGVLTGRVAADLNELGGFYGDYFFRGLDGALQANVDTAGAYPLDTPPLTLSAAGFDVGLPMENLRLDFSFARSGVLHIDTFTTDVLDGTVSGSDITYDFTRERNEVLVQFDGLEIERMMDLIEYQGVEAKGAVSGELPLTLTRSGVEVAAGVLRADAPGGTIRYLAAANGATGNAGLDLVHQALGNYQFDELTSGIEYAPDGELLLSMKLAGHNPDMQNGQRINLNLNLSNNIPDLLESLQAARRIEDFLEEQYQ